MACGGRDREACDGRDREACDGRDREARYARCFSLLVRAHRVEASFRNEGRDASASCRSAVAAIVGSVPP
eukprot:scaffold703_cov245-Pinguiococcus_pyrenoidosus.AAC.8